MAVTSPRMVAAEVPHYGRTYYLVDDNLDFLSGIKEFLDWKLATRRAPSTRRSLCQRLWYLCAYLQQHQIGLLDARPPDLVDFLNWLSNPHRTADKGEPQPEMSPLGPSTINQIIKAAGAFYRYAERHGWIETSPIKMIDTLRSTWLLERDPLAHMYGGAGSVARSELKLAEPIAHPKTIAEHDFRAFLESIAIDTRPDHDPAGFRDRLIALVLKEGGLRLGELAGLHIDDVTIGPHENGVHVRFRADNDNDARAKAGFGRDRFVHLPPELIGLLDVYISEVWVRVQPRTHLLWVVVKPAARSRAGACTSGTGLHGDRIRHMFQHYSAKSGVHVTPHLLRHTHATDLVRSYLRRGEQVDWKYIQGNYSGGSARTDPGRVRP